MSTPAAASAGRAASRGILRSSSLTLSATVAGVVLAFVTSVFVARSLGPSVKGAFDLLLATAQLLALALGLALPSGIAYVIARGAAGARRMAGFVVVAALAQGAVALVVLGILTRVLGGDPLGQGMGDAAPAVLVSGLVAITAATLGWRAILVGSERVPLASWLDVVGRAMTLGLVVAVVISIASPDAVQMLFAWLVGAGAGAALLLVAALRVARGPREIALRTALRFAAPSWIANLLQFLNYRLDLFLVGFFRDLQAVGLYALAATLAQLLWLVSNSIASVLFPRIAVGDEPSVAAARRSGALARAVLVIGALLAGLMALLGPILVPLVYGTAFADAVPALLVLLPGVVLFGPANVLAAHLAGMGRPALNTAVSAVGLALTIAFDLTLIPAFGIVGAAAASTLSYGATSIAMAFAFARATGLPLREVILPGMGRSSAGPTS